MSQFVEEIRYKLKTSSGSLLLLTAKLFVGFVIGLTFALIGQEIINYGDFSFLLVIVVTMAAFTRVAKKWKFWGVLSFAIICVLLGFLIRMYIIVAPGA